MTVDNSKNIPDRLLDKARNVRDFCILPSRARKERFRDRFLGLGADPGIDRAVAECVAWLCRAQDSSTSKDGGVARHYSLVNGWGASYPETTGYIIPTMMQLADQQQDVRLAARTKVMLDWLVDIQLPEGGFQGGLIDSQPVVPVTFNTGQILMGLARGAARYGEPYLGAMHSAGEWLANSIDADGCWRQYPTPFAKSGEKSYETHVAWGLFEAARVDPVMHYVDAARMNIEWAITKQHENGWFDDCCLTDPMQPLTHTIGYALRGILEAYRYTREKSYLDAALRTGEGILKAIEANGFLPGRLNRHWTGTVDYACLTGTVQIAHCWLLLYQETKDSRFRDSALIANQYVRRTMQMESDLATRGAVKGSFPVSGSYGTDEYLSWAAKFFIDANLYEQTVLSSQS